MASLRRPASRPRPPEGNENDSDSLADPVPLPPPRTPLVTIPDPSQNPRGGPPGELEVPKADHLQLWVKGAGGTPRSAQNTPTRSLSRIHCGNGGLGSGNGGRLRERGSSSRAVRATVDVKTCPSAEACHFELDEDPLFWNDHNVQVLIRIRPVNGTESASQCHGRCLRQESTRTLVWTGHPETRFTFDCIACESISQETLFKSVGVPMVENCMSGYNSCMFAYGQTGSGKTYTMMGEIRDMENNILEDRGMTPRIFEYLFAKIREEEENRKNEKLKYSCKCSYLEIYNEQITDLLDPSSTNLQLREDAKKGVYVENLKEHDVSTVKDVIDLLLQGTANRKIAATNMNSESSRSHSVFTCRIESQWEKDSMIHIRFGRLNLVDLAGSERQKSSGAEGERLKEAANINRSLSILGLVIMTLVDIASGKHRHVPYRDSRLTFLLQDSLGGNSKTTIIANVSPSICSANETLSTLKFAQRAKLIQNNAKVNEDASGDVMALQCEIRRLRDQLNIVIKHQNIQRSLFGTSEIHEMANVDNIIDKCDPSTGGPTSSLKSSFVDPKMKYLNTDLESSLRREKMAEVQIRNLEAENERMKQLVQQMEADVQRTNMMLHLRDETIRRSELLADGLISGNEYLMAQNNALNEEIKLLKGKIDSNPELSRFELENIKHLEQLRVFQNFYEQGEREILLDEISQLRNELLKVLEGKHEPVKLLFEREIQVDTALLLSQDATCILQGKPQTCELVDCGNKCVDSLQIHDHFTREADDFHCQSKCQPLAFQSSGHSVIDCSCRESRIIHGGSIHAEPTLVDNCLGDGIASLVKLDKVVSHQGTDEILDCGGMNRLSSHAKFGKAQGAIKDNENLNMQFANENCSQLTQFYEMEQIREQVEAETAQTILNLQQELAVLQQEVSSRHASDLLDEAPSMLLRTENQELKERLYQVTIENTELLDIITAKDVQISIMVEEWEKAVIDLTNFLLDGCQSLEDASDQIHSIADSFPWSKTWISDHVERAMKAFLEKEKLIVNLQKSLEDAQKMGQEMALKLNSLKKATLAITEVQQLEHDETLNELLYLQTLLNEKMSKIQDLEKNAESQSDQIIKPEKQDNAIFIATKRLNEIAVNGSFDARAGKLMIDRIDAEHLQLKSNQGRVCKPAIGELKDPFEENLGEQAESSVPDSKLLFSLKQDMVSIAEEMKLEEDASSLNDIPVRVGMSALQVLESNNELFACYRDTQTYIASLVSDISDAYSAAKIFLQQLIAEICDMKKYFRESGEHCMHPHACLVESSVSETQCGKLGDPKSMVQLIKNDLTKANERLKVIKLDIEKLFGRCGNIFEHENFAEADSIVVPEKEEDLRLNENEILHFWEELDFFLNTLTEIHAQWTVLLGDMEDTKSSSRKNCSSEIVEVGTNIPPKNSFSQLETQIICPVLHVLEQNIEETDASCCRNREMLHVKLNDAWKVADKETEQAATLFRKFNEVQGTMEEADLMLNELLRANETARFETDMWKQASQAMQSEKASLAAEVERMRNTLAVDEQWSQILGDQIYAIVVQIPRLMSELEEMFQTIQNDTKSELKAMHSDILSCANEMRECMRASKAWFGVLFYEVMHTNFSSTVPKQQHIGVIYKGANVNLDTDPVGSCHRDSSSIIRDGENSFLHIRNSLGSIMEGAEEKFEGQAECKQLSLGGNQELLNAFQAYLSESISNVDSTNFKKVDILNAIKSMLFRIAKLEKEKTELINDMKLVKCAISNKVMLFECFIKFIIRLSLQHEDSKCSSSPLGNECSQVNGLVEQLQECDTSISCGINDSVMCADLKCQSHVTHDSSKGVARNIALRLDEVAGATDVHALVTSIQQLKAQCAKLITLEKQEKSHSQSAFLCKMNFMQNSDIGSDNSKPIVPKEMKPLEYVETNIKHANQIMQALDELGNALSWLTSWLHSELDGEREMDIYPSLLKMHFQEICNLEANAQRFLESYLINVIEQTDNVTDNMLLKRDLDSKDILFKNVSCEKVLKDSVSTDKEIKDEAEETTHTLSLVQHELALKIIQVETILQDQRDLASQLADSEAALSSSRAELSKTKDALTMLIRENNKMLVLLEDVNSKKIDTEKQLKAKEKVIEKLEKEILCINASMEERIFSSVEEIVGELRLVNDERDQLQKEVVHLNEKLEMACALADENEAVATEARQDAEASKIFAEQKEEEVKVLESSVEELESTINVLEKKVFDMGEEVESYRLITEDLEQELQTLRERVFTETPVNKNFDIEDCVIGVQQKPREFDDVFLELSVSRKRIKDLEKECACQAEEIKQYREHISEIILHSEAQSSHYQQKFQALEALASDSKVYTSVSNHVSSTTSKIDKNSMRQRGSGSPFRCISSLVQQMNSEKDQELSVAKLRIEELETLGASRQKQVCLLSARLAAVDNMTHDVIRDLLEVKLDMKNYTNLVEMEELHKLIENGWQQNDEKKDEEILKLKAQINALIEEKDSLIKEMKTDILTSQAKLEKLHQRDQLLTAQNEMLKIDKVNLTSKIAELDEMIKELVGSQSIKELMQTQKKESNFSRHHNKEFAKRLAESDKLLRRAKNEVTWCQTSNSSEPFVQRQ